MKNMIRNIFALIFMLVTLLSNAQDEKINVIVFGAHPDDADADAGGTAIKFAQMGHNVMFVSLTNGDAGHFAMGGGALARIRRAEAEEAGKRAGVKYVVLDNHDGELMPTLYVRLQVIRLIREWEADLVIGPRPNDYHPDHRNCGILLQDAAYMVIVPNVAPDTPPLKRNPIFLFAQDFFQKPNPFTPDIVIDISDTYKQKIYTMAAHESQHFEWLPWTSGRLDEIPEDDEERLDYLARYRKIRITDAVRKSLVKWYGKDKAALVTDAEAFEICEYGRRPGDDEIRRLFPMIK
jgi:LmbE family N-acetylglucosaminyl deacetylase